MRSAKVRRPIVAFAVAASAIGATFLAVPSSRDWLVVEDGPLETATALVFAAAAVIAFVFARRHSSAVAWFVAVFATLGFLDEISFGARIFGLTPPEVDGITVDSLHDVFDLGERFAEHLGIGRSGIGVIGLAVIGIAAFVISRNGRAQALTLWTREHPAVGWCAAAVGLALTAVALDLLGGGNELMRLAEELLELAAATATLVGAGTLAPLSSEADTQTPVGAPS